MKKVVRGYSKNTGRLVYEKELRDLFTKYAREYVKPKLDFDSVDCVPLHNDQVAQLVGGKEVNFRQLDYYLETDA